MESPHKLVIAEAQVRAGQTYPPAFVRHVLSGRGRSTCRSPAPLGRLFRSLALAQPGRWKADAGAAFPPPAAPRGAPRLDLADSGHQGLRRRPEAPSNGAPRPAAPLAGHPLPFRRTGTRLRSFPDSSPPFPRASALGFSRSPWRRLAHIGTPRSRSAHTTCHPPASRAKGPRETSHNSPGRVVEVAALASLAPSRRLLDADSRAALRRSAEASGACIRQARIAYRFWVGAQGPGRHEKGTDHVHLLYPQSACHH